MTEAEQVMWGLIKDSKKVHLVPSREDFNRAYAGLLEDNGTIGGYLVYAARPHYWAHVYAQGHWVGQYHRHLAEVQTVHLLKRLGFNVA